MADSTINYGLPFPEGGDQVAVHSDIEKLAKGVDAQIRVVDSQSIKNHGLAQTGMHYTAMSEGSWYISSGSLAESIGMPKRAQGWVSIIDSPQGQRAAKFTQVDIVSSTSLEVWEQTTDHTGAWNRPWHRIYPAPAPPQSSVVSHRHQILSDDQYNAVGGVVYTDGATPVALTWDDWPADTRDLVVAMLRARGITATLALPSRILTPERAPYLGGEGITWPEIDAWVAEGIFEIANHSATHMGASTPEGLRDEIETSLDELHEYLPSATVRCWIQPSVNYPDFNNGNSLDAWTRTEAGQLILDNHALATGLYRREPGVFSDPRLGKPVQGTGRTWIDSGTAFAQSTIAALAGTNRGIIIGAHANRLTMGDGYTTPAQLASFLDWLVDEQDAGRVRLLTLSEWAWADTRPRTNYSGDGVWEIS